MRTTQKFALGAAALTLSTQVLADGHASAPKIYGRLAVEAVSADDRDLDARVTKARLGAKGDYSSGKFKIMYELEADFNNTANSTTGAIRDQSIAGDSPTVRTARVLIPDPIGGLFVFGRTPSGQHADIYGGIDIFERNSSALFLQPFRASRVLAWKSPTVAGGLYGVGAILTLNNNNDEDLDATAFRFAYRQKNWHVAGGQVRIAAKYLGAAVEDDYVRTAFGGHYGGSNWHVGATLENNKDHPAGDSDVVGFAGNYRLNSDWTFAAGHYNSDHDNDAMDNNVTIINVTRNFGKNAKIWFENATYDLDLPKDSTSSARSNFSVGVQVRF